MRFNGKFLPFPFQKPVTLGFAATTSQVRFRVSPSSTRVFPLITKSGGSVGKVKNLHSLNVVNVASPINKHKEQKFQGP